MAIQNLGFGGQQPMRPNLTSMVGARPGPALSPMVGMAPKTNPVASVQPVAAAPAAPAAPAPAPTAMPAAPHTMIDPSAPVTNWGGAIGNSKLAGFASIMQKLGAGARAPATMGDLMARMQGRAQANPGFRDRMLAFTSRYQNAHPGAELPPRMQVANQLWGSGS